MRLPKQLIADLASVRDLEPERLYELNEQIVGAPRPPATTTELSDLLGVAFGNRPQAESIFQVLMFLAGYRRQFRLSVAETLDQVRSALKGDAEWNEQELQRWDHVRPAFVDLLANGRVNYLVKELELRYDYANLLESSRIITDLRPVFNDDASELEGVVVSFTLRLRYAGVDGRHGISIAIDEADVRLMLEECERAIQKAQTARARMGRAQIRTSITGEKSDAQR